MKKQVSFWDAKNQGSFFSFRRLDDEYLLRRWLHSIKFNSCAYNIKDKNGFPILPLSWDWKPDSEWSKKRDKAGIIWCANEDLYEKVETIITDHLCKLGVWKAALEKGEEDAS